MISFLIINLCTNLKTFNLKTEEWGCIQKLYCTKPLFITLSDKLHAVMCYTQAPLVYF